MVKPQIPKSGNLAKSMDLGDLASNHGLTANEVNPSLGVSDEFLRLTSVRLALRDCWGACSFQSLRKMRGCPNRLFWLLYRILEYLYIQVPNRSGIESCPAARPPGMLVAKQ